MSDKGTEEGAGAFVPLSVLVEAVMAQDKSAFLEQHPESLLLIDNPGDGGESATFQTIDVVPGGSTETSKRDKVLAKLGSAGSHVFVMRREPNKFASMITIGRAANNGMRLNVGSVSKFHAYFTHVARDQSWYLADAHSSNGTFIDGQELPPSHGKHPLKSGCVLRFGPDVTAQYFEADGFWELVHGRGAEDGTRSIPAKDAAQGPETTEDEDRGPAE